MTKAKRLYRSRDALIGGVCAGVADYCNVDPLVARILAIVLTLASGGVLGIAYVAMWAVVPKAPKEVAPFDVEPESVCSDTYGTVDCRTARGAAAQDGVRSDSAAQAAAQRYGAASPYAGAAHVPPEPPAGAAWACRAPGQTVPGGGIPVSANSVPDDGARQPSGAPASVSPETAPSYSGWSYVEKPAAPVQGQGGGTPSASVKAALWLGSILLFAGIVSAAATFIDGISWWQYWPLLFMIVGIVHMVVPGVPGRRMRKFVNGLMCFSMGAVLLVMSTGLVAWRSLGFMFAGLWPLLLMMVGFLVLGGALKSPVFTLMAGLCFAVFCVAGLLWCSVPGSAEQVVFSAPYGRQYFLDIPRSWILDGMTAAVG